MLDRRLQGDTRIAVDVGGTFTDVVVHDVAGRAVYFDKVPTTPDDPSAGIFAAFERVDQKPAQMCYFAHGTTLALNALLTRGGARVGLITTGGFRDVYLLGRTDRPMAYDFRYRKPTSLVPRERIFEVPERMNYRGEVLLPLDEAVARKAVNAVRTLGLTSVAVCFLHSYANPAHERLMGAILEEAVPGVEVTLSSTLIREYREYERTSTAVLDAYIKPLLQKYIGALDESLRRQRFTGRFFMVGSGGGAMTPRSAREAPVNLILSGPAGGVLGAVEFARLAREPNLITIDMGGTSLDASLVVGGEALVQHEASFEGLPIMVPSLEIHTIGAGGGSVLWADAGGHLQVGPHSAGARPGPAAYGIGGAEATITDAALVCGYLSPESALAGTLRLDSDLASTAVANLAVGLGIDAQDVAAGAMQIAVTKTAGAVRAITVDQGYTPSDFGLLAFGGAGGLVATSVARELQVSRVIVPRGAGSFSAWGMLMANVHHELAQTFVAELDRCDAERIDRVLLAMEADGRRALKDDGFDEGKQRFLRLADLRYKGQEHSVTIGVARSVDKAEVLRLKSAFSRAHGQRYGHALDDPVEIVTLRSRAVGVVERPPMPKVPARSGDALASIGARRVYAGTGKWSTYGVYRYGDLRAGDVVVGPAIVDDTTGTTVLHSGDSGRVGTMGELQISVVGASHGS